MKNLLSLLLLVISVLASGQSNSQSLEVETKYWKSIAESNDTVAYREYLQRYGEDGLYKDEAITRIALLKTSGKQAQSDNIQCFFYYNSDQWNKWYSASKKSFTEYVVRIESVQSKVWFKRTCYDTIRANLAVSKDFYENQAAVAMSRDLYEKAKKHPIIGKITDNNMKALPWVYITATHTPSGKQYRSESSDANGNYYLSIPSGGPYKISYSGSISYRNRKLKPVDKKDITISLGETKIINAVMDKKSSHVIVEDETIPHHKIVWTADEEYQYDPMKSTSVRDVYVKRDNLHKIHHHKKNNSTLFKDGTYFEYDDEYRRHNGQIKIFEENGIDYEINTMQGYRYVAFSKDKSSFIMWFEVDDNLDGVILEKREYKSLPKEELLPKAVNYDFLNE